MKKHLLMIAAALLLFSFTTPAQVFDEPIDSTIHYNLRLYDQGDHVPNTILNEDKEIIDSVMYSLIAWVDSLQYALVTDTSITQTPHLVMKVSNYATGYGTFTGTEQVDTLVMAATMTDSTDIFLLTPLSSTITANDVLSALPINGTDTLIVYRPASGTSGLKYNYRWIRRY